MTRRPNADADAVAALEPLAYGSLRGRTQYMLAWSLETTPACNGPRDTRPRSRQGRLLAELETGEVVDLDCDNFTPLRRFAWRKQKGLSPALRKALKNPLVPGPPPRYVMGGMGRPTIWIYKGRTVEVLPGRQDWQARWMDIDPDEDPDTPKLKVAWGRDEQEALANARHQIDLWQKYEQYPDTYYNAEQVVHHALDYMHDHTKRKPTRANVARQIQEIANEIKRRGQFTYSHRGETRALPLSQVSFDAFNALPLAERQRLIEEVIAYQIRANLWEPERLPNPLRERIERLERKVNLLAYNPAVADVLPVIKRGQAPELLWGTVGRRAMYRYRGYDIEILQNIPELWDVNIESRTTPRKVYLSSRTYDGAVCLGKITVDVHEALDKSQYSYELAQVWQKLGELAHDQATRRKILPTRSTVARALQEELELARQAGQQIPPRWQWFDSLPLRERVRLIDDKLEALYCAYGTDLRNWP